MKSEEEFNAFYENSLQPKVVEIDNDRKAQVKKIAFRAVFVALLPLPPILFFIYRFQHNTLNPDASPVGFIGGMVVVCYVIVIAFGGFTVRSKSALYAAKIKDLIIPEMLKFFEVDLTYDSYRSIMEKTIEISNLFDGFNNCNGGDYIEGKMGNTFIQFSNTVLIASGQRTDEIVFKGIFLVATSNKSFDGQYMVYPKRLTNPYIDVPGQGIVKAEEIKLENPEFRNYFSTFGTDQVEARYLLSPALMEQMLDFRNVINDKAYFAFARNHFFVAFPTKTGQFEPGLYTSLVNDQVKDWCRNIHIALSIVDEFKLNEHLWSKP